MTVTAPAERERPGGAGPSGIVPAGRNAAIDGLRGFALLGMLAWHAEVGWIRGGFARMTIFFVLSGFLAAQSYCRLREREPQGAFRRFWMRRARRLLPTTLLGVAVAIVVTVTIGTTEARRDVAGDVAATLGNVANWRFIAAGRPYGALFERPSSLQHYWSLAVEEQCFWALPIVLALCGLGVDRLTGSARARGEARQRRLVLLGAVGLGLIPVLVRLDPDTVYYGTHVRGAEFLVGVWLGLWLAPEADGRLSRDRVRLLRWAGPVGLASLAIVMLTIDRDHSWLYRGGLGLFALPAAAAVGGAAIAAPVLRSVLGWPLFRLPGRWALSIYALHWPLFQVLDRWAGHWSAAPLVAAKFTVALAVGAAAFRWFEQPLSFPVARAASGSGAARLWSRDRVALAGFATVAVALLLAGALVHRPAPVIDFDAAQDAAAERQLSVALPPASRPAAPDGSDGATTLPIEDPQRVAVFGSSSGLLLGFTMGGWVREHPGWVDVGGDTGLGCGFLYGGRRVEPRNDRPEGELLAPGPECDWRVRWPLALERGRPTLAIVIPGRWDITDWSLDSGASGNLEDPAFAAMVGAQVGDALDLLHEAGAARVVVTTVPLTGPGESGTVVDEREFPGDRPERIAAFNRLVRAVAADRPFVRVVELAAWADALEPQRHALLFPDGIHTNEEQGPIVWSEFLGPAIDSLVWPRP